MFSNNFCAAGLTGHSSPTREQSNPSSQRSNHGSNRRHFSSASRKGKFINLLKFLATDFQDDLKKCLTVV